MSQRAGGKSVCTIALMKNSECTRKARISKVKIESSQFVRGQESFIDNCRTRKRDDIAIFDLCFLQALFYQTPGMVKGSLILLGTKMGRTHKKHLCNARCSFTRSCTENRIINGGLSPKCGTTIWPDETYFTKCLLNDVTALNIFGWQAFLRR